MQRIPSRPRTPLVLRRAATFTALVLAALASVQCRSVEDTVTGVDIGVHSSSALPPVCLHSCRASYRRALGEEAIRHRRALRACRGRRACIAAERIRHRERDAVLATALRECRRGCYSEGWGSAGR